MGTVVRYAEMMELPELPPETVEALDEFRQYLADAIPPLVVADSMGLLIGEPPQIVATTIFGWAEALYRQSGGGTPISDFFYHAVKKIHLLGDFNLVEKPVLQGYLMELEEQLIAWCPEPDRPSLSEAFQRIGLADAATVAPPTLLGRQGARPPASSAAPAPPAAAGGGPPGVDSRVFSLLLDRLDQVAPRPAAGSAPAPGPEPEAKQEILGRLVSFAARHATTSREFDSYMGKLRRTGLEGKIDDIFRLLATNLPGWAVPAGSSAPGGAASIAPVEAMYRMVTLPKEPTEAVKRFDGLLRCAIGQFNDGELARAVTMFELADRIVTEKKIPASHAEGARRNGHTLLNRERLGAYTEKEADRFLLRRVLTFFPGLNPDGILEQLKQEDKPAIRLLWIALLIVHGRQARDAAFARLRVAAEDSGSPDWLFTQDLVHLLGRIPRDADSPVDLEIAAVSSAAPRGAPVPLWNEVIAHLGEIRTESAATALIARARDVEGMLVSGVPLYSREELFTLLDNCMAALAGIGTPAALRAIVDHGLRRMTAFGDSLTRLAVLSSADLSAQPAMVARLIEALKAELPGKIFGIPVKKPTAGAESLMKALSSTRTPAVRDALVSVQEEYRDHALGQAAAKILASWTAPRPTSSALVPSLVGDVELFGFPNLLQQLAQTEVTGILSLDDRLRGQIGVLALEKGRLRSCRSGMLRNREAVFQLFERPSAATFSFVSQPLDAAADWPLLEMMPLLLEGARRYDELKEAEVIVPHEMRLRPTGNARSIPVGEKDVALVQSVWMRAESGATALECEESSLVDSYRIRRLLSHWVGEGAMQPVA
jgi:hypothetical protein